MHLLKELSAYLASWRVELSARRDHRALVEVDSVAAIGQDIEQAVDQASRHLYTAEQADLEAAAALDRVLADGRVTPAEVPEVRLALRHVRSSARHDHLAGGRLE